MHEEISNFLAAHDIPDWHEFADGEWVAKVYSALAASLFPGSQPRETSLPQRVATFAYLRSLLAVIGIQISYRDLETPDHDQVSARLHQAGEYLRFRAEQMQDPRVLEVQNRFEILKELDMLEATLEPRIEVLESDLAKERGEYDKMQIEVDAKVKEVRAMVEEGDKIDKAVKAAAEAYDAKVDHVTELGNKLEAAKAAWDRLSPFMQKDALVDSVRQLEDAKRRLIVRREQSSNLEAQIKLLTGALDEVAALDELVPALVEAKETLAKRTARQDELVRKRKKLEAQVAARSQQEGTLQKQVEAAKEQLQKLRRTEQELTAEMQAYNEKFAEEKAKLQRQQEEGKQKVAQKTQELSDIQDAAKLQLEANAQVKYMLEHGPKRLEEAEQKLDNALGAVAQWDTIVQVPSDKEEEEADMSASSVATSS